MLGHLRLATETSSNWPKAWHQWALFNVAVMQHHVGAGSADIATTHVAPAVHGFFRSVALGQAAGDRTGNLQVGGRGESWGAGDGTGNLQVGGRGESWGAGGGVRLRVGSNFNMML